MVLDVTAACACVGYPPAGSPIFTPSPNPNPAPPCPQVGFDAIANTAEEAQDVGALPWAILGTVGVSTGVYLLLALALALMVYPGIACPSCQFFRDGDQLVTFINAFVDGHGA